MKKYSLVKTFILYSLITFILIGAVLSFVISNHIKNDYHQNLYGAAQIAVDSINESILVESDFDNNIDNAKQMLLEENINRSLSLYMPQSYTMFNNKKKIVLTNRQSSETITANDLSGVDMILESKVTYYISKAYSINDVINTRVFNLYVPIKYKENIAGVLMLQIPEVVIKSHVDMLLKEIILTMSGGLLVLFLLLIRILYSASKTLRNQNNELINQKAEIETAYKQLSDSYRNTISALSNAVDARDAYTAGHSERVTKISLLIGENLGLSADEMKKLEYAALFHDIGKIGIPDHILLKNSKLTDEEFAIIQKHPEMGVNILKSIEFLDDILPIIMHHHERYIGNGYPDKLSGERIPLCSKIISVADTYDAMTSNRPYRKKLQHEVAVDEILRNKQVQFDARIVDAFLVIEKLLNDDNKRESEYE